MGEEEGMRVRVPPSLKGLSEDINENVILQEI
jgi:hypothetical protein